MFIDKKATAKKIKELMKKTGIKAEHIQIYCELSDVRCVYRWLRGAGAPSRENVHKLAELFGVSEDEVIEYYKDENTSRKESFMIVKELVITNLDAVKGKQIHKPNQIINAFCDSTTFDEVLLNVGLLHCSVNEENRVVTEIDWNVLSALYEDDAELLYNCLRLYCQRGSSGRTIYDWTMRLRSDYSNAIGVVEDAVITDDSVVITYNSRLTDILINSCDDYTVFDLGILLSFLPSVEVEFVS